MNAFFIWLGIILGCPYGASFTACKSAVWSANPQNAEDVANAIELFRDGKVPGRIDCPPGAFALWLDKNGHLVCSKVKSGG